MAYFHKIIYCKEITKIIINFKVRLKNSVCNIVTLLYFSIYTDDQYGFVIGSCIVIDSCYICTLFPS